MRNLVVLPISILLGGIGCILLMLADLEQYKAYQIEQRFGEKQKPMTEREGDPKGEGKT